MFEDVMASLPSTVRCRAAVLATSRFAEVAVARMSGDAAIRDAGLRDALTPLVEEPSAFESSVLLDQAQSRVQKRLRQYDEEPIGAGYYLYTALLLVLMGLPVVADDSDRGLKRLVEFSERFAGHVDWQLRKSRILMPANDYFKGREQSMWDGYAQSVDGEPGRGWAEARESAAEYVEAIDLALRHEAHS